MRKRREKIDFFLNCIHYYSCYERELCLLYLFGKIKERVNNVDNGFGD